MTDAESDATLPTISDVLVQAADATAILTWATDELADSFVDFGTISGRYFGTPEISRTTRGLGRPDDPSVAGWNHHCHRDACADSVTQKQGVLYIPTADGKALINSMRHIHA